MATTQVLHHKTHASRTETEGHRLSEHTSTNPAVMAIGVALLLLSPLASLPWGAETHPLAKASAAAIGCALVLSAKRMQVLPRPLWFAVCATIASLVVATAMSGSVGTSFFGSYPRYEGVWVISVYVAALVVGARAAALPSIQQFVNWVLGLGAVATLTYTSFSIVTSPATRVESLLGNASDLGIWAMVVALVLLPSAIRRVPIAIAGVAAALVLVLVSASRGAILALVAGLVVFALMRLRNRTPLVMASVIGALGLLAAVLPATRGRILGTDVSAARTTGIRRELWGDTWSMILDRPLFGYGPSQFMEVFEPNRSREFVSTIGDAYVMDSPHNIVLQALVVGGLVTLLATVITLAIWAYYAMRAKRVRPDQTAATIAALFAFALALNFHFTSPGLVPLAAFLAGWTVAVSRRVPHSADQGGTAGSAENASVGPLDHDPGRVRRIDVGIRSAGAAWLAACSIVLTAATIAEVSIADGLTAATKGEQNAFKERWETAAALRPWDADLSLRYARASNWAVATGLISPAACMIPTAAVISAHPNSTEAIGDRAKCQAYNNETAAALELLTRGTATNPFDVSLLLLRGRAELILGKAPEAASTFRTVRGLRPHNIDALAGARDAAYATGDREHAARFAAKITRVENRRASHT